MSAADATLTAAGLHVYPVKGLRGVDVAQAAVEPWGLAGDRRWMVVDPAGRFLTQREVPRMALVGAEVGPEALRLDAVGADPLDVMVPLPTGTRLDVVVWRDTVASVPAGPLADRWLSAFLGRPCRLVHMADPAEARPVDPDFATPADRVSFADGFPLLVTTQASLADLNARLAVAVPMNRFRPNLVVAGGPPWAEDDWRRIAVGAVTFRVAKDCARCAVTTVDQATGVRADDTEPLSTLAGFRRRAGGRIIFGQNLIPEVPGTIRMGDLVRLLD